MPRYYYSETDRQLQLDKGPGKLATDTAYDSMTHDGRVLRHSTHTRGSMDLQVGPCNWRVMAGSGPNVTK